MDEYPVTFNSALFTDYPDTVKDTVDYLAANAVLNAPSRPDFYSFGQTRPAFEDQNRIWAELPAFAYVPGTINTPLSFQLPSVTGATSYVFSSLPTGLTCSSSGLITGTPTVSGFFEELLVITTPERVFNNTVLFYIITPPVGANPAPQVFTPSPAGDIYAVRTDMYRITNGSGTTYTNLAGFNGDPLFLRKFSPIDSSGNFYLLDGNIIKKYSSAGTLIGTFATGTSPDAEFVSNTPTPSLVIDSSANIYAFIGGVTRTASGMHSVVKITPAGVISVLAGPGGITKSGYANGTGSAARFNLPSGCCLDSSGNLFVADQVNNRIRKITPAGVVTTFAGSGVAGNTDGTGTAAQFDTPVGICIDSSDNLYVGQIGRIRKITSARVVTTFYIGSTFSSAAVDGSGSIFYSIGNQINKITSAGVLSTFAGSATGGSANGTGALATFQSPTGICIDSSSNLYVTDSGNFTIRKITSAAVVTTLAGNPGAPGSTDGTAGAATFQGLFNIGINISNGDLYVQQTSGQLRKITSAGVVTTPSSGGAGQRDGYLNSALYGAVSGLAFATSGLIYLTDRENHVIRVVDIAGNSVTTLAGSPGSTRGFADGTGSAARFDTPSGLAVDSSGNVYVAEQENKTIRKITSAGVVTTLAGLARASGSTNGTGSAARFNSPIALTVNSIGEVFVYDSLNFIIRKVTSAGVVTTIAGGTQRPDQGGGNSGTTLYDGIRYSARFGPAYAGARMRLESQDDIIVEENYVYLTYYRRLSKNVSVYRDISSSSLFDWSVNAPSSFQTLTSNSSSLDSFYFVGSSTDYFSAFSSFPSITSYSASSLPTGISINTSTGLLTGAPTTVGVYNAVTTTNQTYGTVTKGLTINVLGAAPTFDISPPNLRKYSQGKWFEISALNRGDIILVPASYAIEFPWGQSEVTYDMSYWGEANVTVPALPTPPAGFKYKYYIGKQIGSEGLPVIV